MDNIDPLVLKLKGQWLNDDYINYIKATKSPIKASGSINCWPIFQFYQDDRDIIFGASTTDFHQGIGDGVSSFKELSKKGYYKVVAGKRFPDYPFTFTIHFTNDSVVNQLEIVDMKNNKKTIYHRMTEKNIREAVNIILLAGIYQDSKGQKYIFNENQIAIWPNIKFNYEICLNRVFATSDSFFLVTDKGDYVGKSYSFEIKNNTLSLYETKPVEEGEGKIRDSKPFLILTKIN